MKKNKVEPTQPAKNEVAVKDKAKENTKKVPSKNEEKKPNIFKRIGIKFKEMISELKKVEWPPFKKTKNHSGVIAQTGTVLIMFVIFLIIVTIFDLGLLGLMTLLTKG